jgi:hypothetical protein
MRQKKLLYLISHGHTARGAFQTGLLALLVKQGFEVVVIAKRDPEGELRKQVESQGAALDFYYPPQSNFINQISIFRAYVNQDIRSNPALWEKHQRRAIDEGSSLQRKLVNRLYLTGGRILRSIKPLKRAYLKWEKTKFEDAKAVDILKKHQPDAIISTRPVDAMEAFMLNAARRLSIDRIMYILSWDNITAKGIFPEDADHYLTWGEIMNEELKQYYNIREEQAFLTGVTHFDVHKQVQEVPKVNHWLEKIGLDPARPYFFFTMSASYYAPNEIDIIEWLANQIESDTYGKGMQLILRPHMHNFQEGFSDLGWKERLLSLKSSRVTIDLPDLDNSLLTWYMKDEDMLRLSNLLLDATICFNSGSTIAIESCIMDRPTIITLFDTEEWPEWRSVSRIKHYIHLEKLFKTNAVRVVESFEQMDRWILKYLEHPEFDQANRRKAVELECYKNDGLSTRRFVENVTKILN